MGSEIPSLKRNATACLFSRQLSVAEERRVPTRENFRVDNISTVVKGTDGFSVEIGVERNENHQLTFADLPIMLGPRVRSRLQHAPRICGEGLTVYT